MKGCIITITALLGAISLVSARTWVSADGSKTFEGDLISYDSQAGKVVVSLNGRELTFSESKLSEADQAFLKTWEPPAESVSISEQLAEQEVGKHLSSRVLSRLEKRSFKKAEMVKVPEYYLLYFSASW